MFSVQSAKKAAIHGLIEQLECINPLAAPTQSMEKVSGSWKLLYSTICISVSLEAECKDPDMMKHSHMSSTVYTVAVFLWHWQPAYLV